MAARQVSVETAEKERVKTFICPDIVFSRRLLHVVKTETEISIPLDGAAKNILAAIMALPAVYEVHVVDHALTIRLYRGKYWDVDIAEAEVVRIIAETD